MSQLDETAQVHGLLTFLKSDRNFACKQNQLFERAHFQLDLGS